VRDDGTVIIYLKSQTGKVNNKNNTFKVVREVTWRVGEGKNLDPGLRRGD
jgi:hypothetical protein